MSALFEVLLHVSASYMLVAWDFKCQRSLGYSTECLLTFEVHHVHHVHCVHDVQVHVKSYGMLSPAIRPDLVEVGLRHCLQRRSL